MKKSFSLRSGALAPVLSVLSLAVAASVHAQDALNNVVISASRTEQRIQDALPATTLITRADIDRAQAVDLPSLIRNVTGIEIVQNGGVGTVSSAFIRGAESRHTLVLVDGVPINNLNFSAAALEHIPLVNVERIEVVRGNVSSLYGSNALGGVIQIFTRDAGTSPWTSLTAQVGSRGLVDVSGSTGVMKESGLALTASAQTLHHKGFNAINQKELPGTNPDRDGYSRRVLSAGVSQDLSQLGRIGLKLSESKGVTEYDSQFGPATQTDKSNFALTNASLYGQFKLASDLQLDANMGQTSDSLDASVTAYPYRIKSSSQNSSLGLTWRALQGHIVTAGYETTTQRLDSDTVYKKTVRTLNASRLGYLINQGDHLLQINLRQDDYSDFGMATTGLFGYGYRLTPTVRVSANTSTGFMAPTFNDLYYPYGGNPALRPEHLRSNEIAAQYASGAHDLRVTYFDNQFTDLIGNNSSYVRTNIAKAQNKGVELIYIGKFANSTINAGFTSQDPLNSITQKQLDRRAKILANFGLNQDLGAWSVGAQTRYSSERPDAAQTKTMSAYFVSDLTANYQWSRDLKLIGRINNVFDRKFETAYGYNQVRRGVFAGLNWQMK
jgi:vitamin B12 transporter